MVFRLLVASLLAIIVPCQAALAQGTTMLVNVGGTKPAPVAQVPVIDPKDSPEEIAKDAARDLKDTRFYNKAGATRAQYEADWQTCRLIARGSRTPAGTVPYYYNPAVVSPLAASAGGALGGLIAGAIIEGEQRRANRRQCLLIKGQCLLIKGWRLVELNAADSATVTAMTDAQRSAYFDTIVGAAQVNGTVTERTKFEQVSDSTIRLDAPVAGPSSLFVGRKVDPAAPFVLAQGEAAIVIAFRRPDESSAGRSGRVQLARYDVATRDLVYQPKDWKKKGDKTTYNIEVPSIDRKAPLEVQLIRVTPGAYVISGTAVGPALPTTSNCFGAPSFEVAAGEVAYVGDFTPYMNHKLSIGAKLFGLLHSLHMDEVRAALAARQPSIASAMKAAPLRNGATFACSAITMDRWDLADVESLSSVPSPASAPDGAAAPNKIAG
jgi:hypothetical protein